MFIQVVASNKAFGNFLWVWFLIKSNSSFAIVWSQVYINIEKWLFIFMISWAFTFFIISLLINICFLLQSLLWACSRLAVILIIQIASNRSWLRSFSSFFYLASWLSISWSIFLSFNFWRHVSLGSVSISSLFVWLKGKRLWILH